MITDETTLGEMAMVSDGPCLTLRTENFLDSASITTVGALCALTEMEVLKLCRSRKVLANIVEVLAHHGRTLRDAKAIDWRARALTAEAEVSSLRTRLRSIEDAARVTREAEVRAKAWDLFRDAVDAQAKGLAHCRGVQARTTEELITDAVTDAGAFVAMTAKLPVPPRRARARR